MFRNVEFALLVTEAVTTVAAVDEEDWKSCKEINGGGDDDGEPDTDSTSELSLLSDRYGEHDDESTCNRSEKLFIYPSYTRIKKDNRTWMYDRHD